MPRNTVPKLDPHGATIHLIEPKRFAAITRVLAERGLGDLCLSTRVRIVIDEWIKANAGK